MKNYYIRILFFLSIISHPSFGQVNFSKFMNERDMGEKTRMAIILWNDYLRKDLDSVKILGQKLYTSSKEHYFTFGEAIAMRCFGSYYIRSGKLEDGLHFLKQSYNFFLKMDDPILCSEICNEIGNAYYLMANYQDADKYYLESIRYGAKLSNETAWFAAELGLGKSRIAMGKIEEGSIYLKHYKNSAIAIGKYEAAADAYSALANIELDRDSNYLANFYLNKSLECARKSKSKIHLAHAYTNKAIQKFILGEHDSSLVLFRESLRLKYVMNNSKGITESLFNLGDFYEGIGHIDSAKWYYRSSMNYALSKGFTQDALDAIEMLIEIGDTEDFSSAIDSLKSVQEQYNLDEVKLIRSISYSQENLASEKNIWPLWIWSMALLLLIVLVIWMTKPIN